jgi:hypothetical protein
MKSLILIITSVLLLNSNDKPNYSPQCEIRDEIAYGSVSNKGESFSISGDVWFYFYDCKGELVRSIREYESEFISRKSTEQIEHTKAPDRSCSCVFDITKAIEENIEESVTKESIVKERVNYLTTCNIIDGKGKGSITSYRESFTIEGDVWFYFYDCDGNLIDSEDEYEYEYISSNSTEEIEETSAPSKACSCTFEVKGAIVE